MSKGRLGYYTEKTQTTEIPIVIGTKTHKEKVVIMFENELSKKSIGCVPNAFGKVYNQLDPGLFESAYQECYSLR